MATPNLDNMSLEQLEHILNSQQDELAKLDAELAYIEQMENKMNEELVADLQAVANLLSPGLYDLSQPDQLEEFINGINDGTIPLTPAVPAPAAGAAGAVPAGIPVPGAGAVPAGIPGAGGPAGLSGGLPGAPAPII